MYICLIIRKYGSIIMLCNGTVSFPDLVVLTITVNLLQ